MPEVEESPAVGQGECDTAAAVLRSHPQVRVAAVEYVEDPGGAGAGLVARAVPEAGPGPVGTGTADAVVEAWQAVFDDCYEVAGLDDDPVTAGITGWTDSLTGQPVPAAQMAEWVDTTVARLAALPHRRILEIGAGTGLLMNPLVRALAPEVYTATDFSARSVDLLRELAGELAGPAPRTGITVEQAEATAPPPGGPYDLVIVNSVVQYFPSTLYLEEVLRQVLPSVVPGGHVFLGDLRHAGLREAFACLKHRRRSGADSSAVPVRVRVDRELRLDGELSLLPDHLHALPGRFDRLTGVDTAPRRGAAPSEMTLFRYDAVLHVGCSLPAGEAEWHDGGELTADEVRARLADAAAPFGFRGVPNARLAEALALRGVRGEAGPERGREVRPGADPEQLARLVEKAGWTAGLRWTPGDDEGRYDLWCTPPGREGSAPCRTVPGAAGTAPSYRQPVFSPRGELSWARAVLSAVNAELPSGLALRQLSAVTALP
ncbi:class I SAM-dependent methyltransferase [Streptomyces sp. NPDC001388]|uniref:class I SAM-dependent methyltransferase n=1 Tax=Streptomyces sp. NPDC001388 TaxID=3364568 RepID=UPI0036C36A90